MLDWLLFWYSMNSPVAPTRDRAQSEEGTSRPAISYRVHWAAVIRVHQATVDLREWCPRHHEPMPFNWEGLYPDRSVLELRLA